MSRASIRPGNDLTLARLRIENEATPTLAILIDGGEAEIEIRNLSVRTLFASRTWSAPELASLLQPQGGITNLQIKNGSLTFHSSGKDASLRTIQDLSPQLAALRQAENLFFLFLGIGALGLYALSKILGASEHIKESKRAKPSLSPVTNGARQRASKKRIVIIGLLVLLFAWGCFRILAATIATPLVGYANTNDFYRLLACYGLKADTPIDAFDPKVHSAPVSRYIFVGNPIKEACYLSSQTFLLDVALGINQIFTWPNIPPSFDLRALGIVSTIASSITVAVLLLCLARVSLFAALGLAAMFALVLSDPFITLYANTFLSEYAAVLFLLSSGGLGLYILISRNWSSDILFIFALSILLLGTARLQNLALPFVFTGWLIVVSIAHRDAVPRWKIVSGILILLLASMTALGIQSWQNARAGSMRATQKVNRSNTYYMTLLPAMREPLYGLRLLGLPEECAPYIGKSWYQMQPRLDGCAVAARELSTIAYLELVWHDPWMLQRLLTPVIDQTRPWILGNVGQIEGGDFDALNVAFPAHTWSISSFVHSLPLQGYRALVVWLGMGALISAFVLALAWFKRSPTRWVELALFQWRLTAVFLYIVGTAVLGDGYWDLDKHTLLAKPALLLGDAVGFVLVGLLLWNSLLRLITKERRAA